MKKSHLLLYLLVVAMFSIAIVGWFLYHKHHHPIYVEEEIIRTDGRIIHKVLETPELIVGEWINVENPQWHKVYYDDPAEDASYYWGKEWDEDDGVYEEDLLWHGNGWFVWQLRGNTLIEMHQMENNMGKVIIPYNVCSISTTGLVYIDVKQELRKTYTFVRM